MSMATVTFYKNPYVYPNYGSITAVGSSEPCTPKGTGLKTGTLHLQGDMSKYMACNYLRLQRDGKTLYAWIEDVATRTANSFEVSYRVDAWRTYRSNITLGTQYIERRPQSSIARDEMLGSANPRPIVQSVMHNFDDNNKRVFVVQVRTGSGEVFSRTPVQPSPYQFFVTDYVANNWTNTSHIEQLMSVIMEDAEPTNIVTMYSVPYFDVSNIPPVPLTVKRGSSGGTTINGFRLINHNVSLVNLFTNEASINFDSFDFTINELMRTDHSVQVVIPEAGIMTIPDELIGTGGLFVRQDIDIFSGASNYMLFHGGIGYLGQSVRGSSVSSIPIVSDPLDTYLSQNQNALTTSLMGDVASILGGTAMALGSGGIGAGIGAGGIASGVSGIVNRYTSIQDAGNRYSNPPAFLGTALSPSFNGNFWVVVTRTRVDNASVVHSNYGYAYDMIDTLTFPSSGYIKTQGCAVTSDGTVPKWAIEEVNQMFDNGVLVN